MITPAEQLVMDALVATWNAFLDLPSEHMDDTAEFRHGIHRLQEKILARPTRREINRGPAS